MTVGASRAGASDMPGSPCRELKDDNKTPGQPSDLEYVLRQREGNANRRGLECVRWVYFKFKCNEVKATVQVALLPGFGAFAGQTGSFTEKDIFSMETCQNRSATSTACNDEEELGQCAKKKTHISNEELHRKFGIVQIAMRLSSRRLRMVKRMAG